MAGGPQLATSEADPPQVVPREKRAVASVRTLARGIPCEGCDTLFTPRRPSQRYCRPACRPRAHRRRQREWLQQAQRELHMSVCALPDSVNDSRAS